MGSCFCIPKKSSQYNPIQIKNSNIYSHNKDTTDNTHNGNHTPPELMQPLIDQHSASVSASLGSNIITTNTDTTNNFQDISDTSNHSDIDTFDIAMEQDKLTLLSIKQTNTLKQNGYCKLADPLNRDIQIRYAVEGYIRHNYNGCINIVKELIRQIIYYYGQQINTKIYIELVCNTVNPTYLLVPRRNIILSIVLKEINQKINKIELNEYTEHKSVDIHTLHHVFRYLHHHKGKEPDPLPCPVRSIHMAQIVSDKWDAMFIDSFEKKQIFEIILVANQLKIQCLLHLGCAKIATLIKQLDQKDINRIIEDEEKYRREHAQDNDDNNKDNEEKENMDETDIGIDNDISENEIVLERKCTDLVDRNSDEYEKDIVKNEMNEK